MKICIIGPKAVPYTAGIENFVEEVGSRFARLDNIVFVYVRQHYYEKFIKSYKSLNLIYAKGINSKNFDAITHSLWAVIHSLLFLKPDVYYFHGIGLSPLIIFPKLFNKKVILHTHGLDSKRKKWGKFAKIYLKFCQYTSSKLPDIKISVSEFEKRFYNINYKSNFINIPTGVKAYLYREPKIIKQKYNLGQSDYILFLARLVPEKGCHLLLKAYQEIETKLKLVIAGDDKYSKDYINYLYEISDGNKNIVFTGFVTGREMEELLSNCFYFIQPSELEGLPHSILQALSYNKFILASDIPGNKEAVGRFGIFFRKNDVNDLKKKMQFVNKNYHSIFFSKSEIQKYININYSWDNISMRINNLLEKLVK